MARNQNLNKARSAKNGQLPPTKVRGVRADQL